jgi:hypothetical protein
VEGAGARVFLALLTLFSDLEGEEAGEGGVLMVDDGTPVAGLIGLLARAAAVEEGEVEKEEIMAGCCNRAAASTVAGNNGHAPGWCCCWCSCCCCCCCWS